MRLRNIVWARLYERGKGVAKDMKAALGWYERAAALGNVKAMHNAAVLAASNDQQSLTMPALSSGSHWVQHMA